MVAEKLQQIKYWHSYLLEPPKLGTYFSNTQEDAIYARGLLQQQHKNTLDKPPTRSQLNHLNRTKLMGEAPKSTYILKAS